VDGRRVEGKGKVKAEKTMHQQGKHMQKRGRGELKRGRIHAAV